MDIIKLVNYSEKSGIFYSLCKFIFSL